MKSLLPRPHVCDCVCVVGLFVLSVFGRLWVYLLLLFALKILRTILSLISNAISKCKVLNNNIIFGHWHLIVHLDFKSRQVGISLLMLVPYY